jgi:hypothetical protein
MAEGDDIPDFKFIPEYADLIASIASCWATLESVDRIVIVSYQGNSGSSIPTLNGTAMNVAAGDSVATYNNALYYASVPTGSAWGFPTVGQRSQKLALR